MVWVRVFFATKWSAWFHKAQLPCYKKTSATQKLEKLKERLRNLTHVPVKSPFSIDKIHLRKETRYSGCFFFHHSIWTRNFSPNKNRTPKPTNKTHKQQAKFREFLRHLCLTCGSRCLIKWSFGASPWCLKKHTDGCPVGWKWMDQWCTDEWGMTHLLPNGVFLGAIANLLTIDPNHFFLKAKNTKKSPTGPTEPTP